MPARAVKNPYEGVQSESIEQARRRRLRQVREERDLIARDILDNDDEVGDMKEARARADEVLELRRQVDKGLLDPSTGKPTSKGKKVERAKSSERSRGRPVGKQRRTSPPRSRPTKARPAGRRIGKFGTKSIHMVAAPFGSVASAAWTFAMGGLSIVLLYLALSRQGSGLVTATLRGLGSGFRNITNPYTPLFGSKVETSPPPPTKKVLRTHKKTATQAMKYASHGTRSGRTGRHGSGTGGPQ